MSPLPSSCSAPCSPKMVRESIFDVTWNPCPDQQAMCRCHRFGQKKDVFVYRMCGAASMERKVLDQQIRKDQMFKRVVDDHDTKAVFSSEEALDVLNEKDFAKLYPDAAKEGAAPSESTVDIPPEWEDDVGHDVVLTKVLGVHSRSVKRIQRTELMIETEAEDDEILQIRADADAAKAAREYVKSLHKKTDGFEAYWEHCRDLLNKFEEEEDSGPY